MIRKIVEINEKLCNGCMLCVNACHEGAISIVNGKAKLIKDHYCDGLGDCLPACPQNAISIIEREADAYDEEAVLKNINKKKSNISMYPGSIERTLNNKFNCDVEVASNSALSNWPVQIKLVPTKADYFENADILVAADCSAYAYAAFHNDFIKNRIAIIGCPKLDSIDYSEKLTEIFKSNKIRSIKVVRMEVPCCSGLENAVIRALQNSNKNIPLDVVIVTCDGDIKNKVVTY